MNKIKLFLSIGFLSLTMFSTTSAEARKKDRGENYVENGHLYVWYQGDYKEMGLYNPQNPNE